MPWSWDALESLKPALDGDPWGSLAAYDQKVSGSHLVELTRGGQPAGLVAMEFIDHRFGREACIVAASRVGNQPVLLDSQSAIDALAKASGAHVLTAVASRRGVVHLMQKAGWQQTGAVMVRRLRYS